VCIGERTVLPDPNTGATTGYLKAGEWFSLEMIPQIGAPTLMTKRIDAGLENGKPLL
jgi:archaellin